MTKELPMVELDDFLNSILGAYVNISTMMKETGADQINTPVVLGDQLNFVMAAHGGTTLGVSIGHNTKDQRVIMLGYSEQPLLERLGTVAPDRLAGVRAYLEGRAGNNPRVGSVWYTPNESDVYYETAPLVCIEYIIQDDLIITKAMVAELHSLLMEYIDIIEARLTPRC